jgi:hypothetical protein
MQRELSMITWKTTAQDIEEKTQNHWRVSLAWNCRSDYPMPTGEAIVRIKDNMMYTNPERPLYRRSTIILSEIVKGEGSPRLEESCIIPFPDTCAIGV